LKTWKFLVVGLVVALAIPGRALGQPALPVEPPAQTGPMLASDDFQNPDTGFLPHASAEPDSYEQGYEQGYYVVRGVDPAWRGNVNLALPGSYRDTKLSVNVRSIGDRAGAVYLECRRGQDSGYGAVVFLDRGAYFIGRIENDGVSPLSLPGSSPYSRLRRTGMTLSLACVGDRMALSLDGMEIATARDGANTQGSLRVGAQTLGREGEGSFEFRFKNLVANEATPGSQPARPSTATATSTVTPAATPATRTPTPAPLSEADVAAMVSPSVVRIVSTEGTGSGVRIKEGVITNQHVVGADLQVQIQRSDGVRQTARLVRSDAWFDLALLSTDLDLPVLELETAAQQRQGDPLLVLGYPADLPGSSTLTRGLLSAVRDLEGVTLVQTDAAVSFGSSGGAIVNMRGKVIGITEGMLGRTTGLNLGIAGESVQAFLAGEKIVAPDAAEPDDTVRDARTLVVGAPPTEHNFHAAGDLDWVSLVLNQDDEVAIFTDSARCDTVLRLYAPDGATLLDEDDDSGRGFGSWIEFTAPAAGTYLARISHAERGGVCRSYYVAARLLS
jgi:hypothetical protein